MSTTPNLNQVHYRVRTDTGAVDATPTWGAAEDANYNIAVETTFRIRFVVQNTGTLQSTPPFILRVSKNGGAYTAVTTSTGATLGAQSADASTDADETAILAANYRLTAGAGTKLGDGVYDENGSATYSVGTGGYRELEFGLILKTAGAAAGNTFDFRLYNNTTAFTTYTQTPRVTVPRALLANDIVSASSVGHKIIFRSVNYASYGGSRTSTVVPKPSGLIVGDFMLWAQITAIAGGGGAGSAPDPTFPAGWTQISSAGYPLTPGSGGFDADFRIAYKVADSSDAAASNFTATHSTCSSQGAIACWTGVDATTPFDTTPTQNFWNSGIADSTALSLTTVTNGARIVIWGMDWGDTANDLSPPTGTTPTFAERLDVAPLMHMFDGVLATAGATGDKTWANNSATAAPWACYMLALRPAVFVPTDACLANDVLSASSVSPAPQLRQEHAILANDVKSPSSVTHPVAIVRRDLLANDVSAGSSVSVPTAASIVPPVACLANDVKSNSSVTNPSAQQRQALLANDVKSNSTVGQPAAKQLHGALANDVKSNSSVSQPTATQIVGEIALLANDIVSPSNVTNPSVQQRQGLLANDVTSTSSVTTPALGQRQSLDAADVTSASRVTTPGLGAVGGLFAEDVFAFSSVSQPALIEINNEVGCLAEDVASASSVSVAALGHGYGLLAENVASASSVTTPAVGEIEAGSILAEDVVSASSVSTPTLAVEGEVIPPVLGGGGGGSYEDYEDYYRQRRQDEEERESERKRRLRELADIIDRAIARAQGQLEPPFEAETPLPVAEIVAIDDALEAIQDRVQAIEALGSRILQADAELEALRLEAIALIREAELDDDDEALELLLAA